MLEIDGSLGEGGGQVLRTSLSLAALTGRPFRLTSIRAKRSKPGLRPQHLTAVHAVAALCAAELEGDRLNSQTLTFRPRTRPRGGAYTFDVTQAAQGGSAGSVTLILQAILWPLLFADAPARVTLRGGTHVPFSPPYHYLAHAAQPVFARLGAAFTLALHAWGWYPIGQGEMQAVIEPVARLESVPLARAAGDVVEGVAAVTNLPAHIPQRMARRAHNLLADAGLQPQVAPRRERGAGPGAGLFLWAPQGGFSSLGRQGLPAEAVAETAVADCLAFIASETDVDKHLADQLLLPLALAHGATCFTTDELTRHTLTNAALLRQWLDVEIRISGEVGAPAGVEIEGIGFGRD